MSVTAQPTVRAGNWISLNERETFDLGVRIGEQLSGGEIVLLDGPLGAGKTVFVKGIARAFGLDEEDVTSPSFTLVNLHQGRLLLDHIVPASCNFVDRFTWQGSFSKYAATKSVPLL